MWELATGVRVTRFQRSALWGTMGRVGADVVVLHPVQRETPDAALVMRARDGDEVALQQLFERHYPPAVSLAFRLMPADDPEDIAQEAMLEALKGLGQLETPEAFGGWLRRIVVSRVTRRLKRKRLLRRLGMGTVELVDVELVVSRAAPPDLALELKQLYSRLDLLPSDERVALVLRRVEGLALDEVAQSLGVSLSTAKRRVASAEARLQLGGRDE